MRITHPQTIYQGINPDNMFFVSSDQHVQLGTGYIYSFFQQELTPKRPLNMYVQIDAQPSARSLLFGALLARAETIHSQTPGLPARLYTQLDVRDEEMMEFYQHCGMQLDDAEDLFMFSLPDKYDPRPPMGLLYCSAPIANDTEMDAFIRRLNTRRITNISHDQMTLWREQPNFFAAGFYTKEHPVAELVVTGVGHTATLVSMYTAKEHQRQGLARMLVLLACGVLKDRGVDTLYANIFRKNDAQVGLMKSLGAQYVRTVALLPGIDL